MVMGQSVGAHLDRRGLLETLQALIRIPSVTGEEDAAQEYIARRMQELGGEMDCWRVEPEALRTAAGFPGARVFAPRDNVVATFPGVAPGPTLVLNGHIDTVTAGQPERWTQDPFGGQLIEGRVYGRGACDMKGGLAAILGAVQAVRRSGLRLKGALSVQSVVGEEDGGVGSYAALQRGHRGDAVIVCEPTRLAVVPAQAGVTLFRITVHGRSAHGCVRQEGESIADARRELEEQVRIAAGADPWLIDHPPTVEWIGGVWQGTETPAGHPIVQTLSRSVAGTLGRPADVRGVPYGSDLRLFCNDAGVPGVLFGPGDIRLAHFTDECVPLEEVELAACCLADTIVEYCGIMK